MKINGEFSAPRSTTTTTATTAAGIVFVQKTDIIHVWACLQCGRGPAKLDPPVRPVRMWIHYINGGQLLWLITPG